MTQFTINVKSPKSAAALRKALETIEDLEILEVQNERVVKGKQNSQTLTRLCGSWDSNAPRLSADQIRKTADASRKI